VSFDSISIESGVWPWVALAAAVVLVPLAWLALRPAGPNARTIAVALALRTLGIGLLLLCLLNPQLVSSRAVKGANLFAILADNSQSLQIADRGPDGPRGQQEKDALAGDKSAWLGILGEEFQIRPYIFDRDLRRVRDYTELDFKGERTALGAALRQVRERFAKQPLAGVLLFTDGDATDLADGLKDTAGLPPIYPVLMGGGEELRDVRVDRADVHQSDFDDAPVSVVAEIAGQDAKGRDVSVSIRPLPAVGANVTAANTTASVVLPDNQTVRLTGDGEPVQVKFDWHPVGSGIQFYDVGVDSRGLTAFDEATLLNNHRIVMVDRGRPAYRILYVAGRPDWDFKFLNRALADDPQLELPALIRIANREPKMTFIGRAGENSNPLFRGFGAAPDDTVRYDQPVLERVNTKDETELRAGFPRTAEELFSYDAVILEKVEAAFFDQEQLQLLRRFVDERGGGLAMLGGFESFDSGGYAESPIASVLPVYLDRKAPPPQGNVTWKLTREGWLEPWVRVRPVQEAEVERLNGMPKLAVLNPFSAIKPGATILAVAQDGANHNYPALIAQKYGAGRVAAFAVGDMWRTGNLSSDKGMVDLAHFWRQFARWLVTDVPARVELHVEPSLTETGGVTLRVTARDKEFHPFDLASAKITIKRSDQPAVVVPGGFSQVTLTAEPLPDSPGQYAATFAPRDPGAYLAEVELLDKAGNPLGKAQTGWINEPSAEEFSHLAPNRTLLEELARQTGGQVVDRAHLAQFVKDLPNRKAEHMETVSEPIWNQGPVFLAVLACFLTEWGWRRWKGLP